MEYISLPFVLRNGYLDRSNLRDSITHSLGLLLSTRMGMMPFARGYGSDIWEKEFSDLYAANKADIRAGLRNAIDKCEKRLSNVTVSFVETERSGSTGLGIVVQVRGSYTDGNKDKTFEANYVLG